MSNLTPVIIGAAFTFVFGLVGIIYTTLSNRATKNEDEIKDIKEKYVTKEDFNRQNDKMDLKLDKILDLLHSLMGVNHEK